MDWPPQILDLNIIEAVQNHLGREWNKFVKYKEKLWNFFQEAWRTIPGDDLKKLQQSLPEWFQAMVKNKDGHTNY